VSLSHHAFVGLGANLGDREANIRRAVALLSDVPGVSVTAVSRLVETAAVGGPEGQPPYLNGVAELRTGLPPLSLLDVLLDTEAKLGRDRAHEVRWGPRPVDLDLLVHGECVCAGPRLTLPHPRLAERAFVLRPLAELAPDLVVPGDGWTVQELLDALPDGPTIRAP
jgi:2-amino-4-hydroxy-6-hydroxymethyldihydropteridine diphosphokinase